MEASIKKDFLEKREILKWKKFKN